MLFARLVRIAFVAALVCLWLPSARADLLRVGTGLDEVMLPNSSSSTIVIPIFNDQVDGATPLWAWQLELRIIPQAGSTGTVTFGSFAYPADNILTFPFPVAGPQTTTFSSTIVRVGSSDVFFDDGAVVVPASGKNLVALTVNSSPDASGDFWLVATNDVTGGGSNWASSTVSGDQAFTNIPFSNDTQLVLGTITVVPEPGSLAFVGLAGGMFASALSWRRLRSRGRKPAERASETPSGA